MRLGAASMVRMPRWRGEASVLARHTDPGRAMTRIPRKIALLALAAEAASASSAIFLGILVMALPGSVCRASTDASPRHRGMRTIDAAPSLMYVVSLHQRCCQANAGRT